MDQHELNAALQIAGQQLAEADKAWREAWDAEKLAREHKSRCQVDVETLLKVARDLSGERGQQSVWIPDGRPRRAGLGLYVGVGGHKSSLKKAIAICRRLLQSNGAGHGIEKRLTPTVDFCR
jgi:hypothetical protein